MLKLNKEQLQLFNDFKKANNEIHDHPMTVGEKKEYEKRVLDNLCHVKTSGDILCDVTRQSTNSLYENNQNRKLHTLDNYRLTGILKIDGSVI